MFQSWEFFLLNCLFLIFDWTIGEVSPPHSLSVRWIDAFEVELSWIPPSDEETNCTYKACITSEPCCANGITGNVSKNNHCTTMEGGFLPWSVQRSCLNGMSEKVYYNVSYPELVADLNCYIYEPQRLNCSWSSATDATDLRFFYRLETHLTAEGPTELRECPLYTDEKTGCHLQATISQVIFILFNATLSNVPIRNTFERSLLSDVRPPPLQWSVATKADKFSITWTPPNIIKLKEWSFTISYTECEKDKSITIQGLTSYVLNRRHHCRYCLAIAAKSESSRTPPSDTKCFDAEKSDKVLLYAAVIIPLAVFCLVAVIAVCWWKKKDVIFPIIPGPPGHITDFLNKNTFYNLAPVAAQEETCKVTLLADYHTTKPDCRNKPDVNSPSF